MLDELEHYGVKGMRWGIRKQIDYKKLSNKANKYAWKAEKIRRKETSSLAKRIERDKRKGITTTREKPDAWIRASKYEKKAQKLIDKMMPELASIPWSDLEKQGEYKDMMYWKTPKWA